MKLPIGNLPHMPDSEKSDLDFLLKGIFRHYGYDFSHYSYPSLIRRMDNMRIHMRCNRFSELLEVLLGDEEAFDLLLSHMSITVTEMFRDPDFYRSVRQNIIPVLKTFPFVKIWFAGCATGEEAYSMAILLHEENFLARAQIYATDFNKHSLDKGQKGIYALKTMEAYAANYEAAGGKRNFAEYYGSRYELAKLKDYLKERITFSYHNLISDGVFGEMHLIFCRNVLIYFDKVLQNQVLTLFVQSLRHGGFICLGNKESLNFTAVSALFQPADARQRIYRKCGTRHD